MNNVLHDNNNEIKKPKVSFKMQVIIKALIKQKGIIKAVEAMQKDPTTIDKLLATKMFSKIPGKIYRKYSVVKKTYDNHDCYWLYPKKNLAKRYLVYIHGGAYFLQINKIQWNFICKLGELTDSIICVPLHPLAPKYNYTYTFPMLHKFYQDLCKENQNNLPINLIGDSSGGGITLSFAQMIRNEHMPLAKNVILLSPSLDMTPLSEKEVPVANAIEKLDCMLSVKFSDVIRSWWCGNENPNHYFASPIYGGLKGLNNIWVFTSTNDLLNIVARRFKQKAREESVPIHYIERPALPHVWMLFTITRESKEEINNISKIINEHEKNV